MEVTELDRALRGTLAVLAKVEPGHLEARTPCASWNVSALINHFIGTTRWWAGLVTGEGGAADVDYAAGDYVAAYEESIRIAVAAFEADGVLDKAVSLPFGEFPGAVVLDMAAVEQFTHGWDLARAIGYQADLDPGLAAELLGRPGSRSPTRSAVQTARPCSRPRSRLQPGRGRPISWPPSSGERCSGHRA